ncbi:hypothetical protein [Paenibacillus xylanexedens]|uniref:hypothetical protein n=1 Tax=Paenibacillus xylanexedens TaxID=528191 RepID=UPI0011A98670|nr:hypothetical protein [Paenibacillus xylanexedens]
MNEEKVSVRFGYGVLSPTLEEQAKEQGFTLGDKAEFLEELRKAKTMLMFHVLTESQSKSITEKINKKVISSLKPLGN